MRKNYSKPEIMFESFAMSVNIAGGCDRIIGDHAAHQCAVDFGGDMLFLSSVSVCTEPVADGSSEANGLCYDVPYDGNELFNS